MEEEQREQLRNEGFCVFPRALSPIEIENARAALARAVDLTLAVQGSAHDTRIDPNAANQRVYDLPAKDPLFIAMLVREQALAAARTVCGDGILVSNFTANIALPGSKSMKLHSDQALSMPGPWHHPWTMNVIWCLDDVDEENGATRYLPGSHRIRDFNEVPVDAAERLRAFSAPAGSSIAMEGRLWHTSGANVSKDRQRRLMFAYYAADFMRPQANWNAVLPAETQATMDDELRRLFALGTAGNTRVGGGLTRL